MFDKDTKEMLLVVSVMLGIVVGAGFLIMIGIQAINLMLQPNVVVTIDGKQVYAGSNVCVDETSLGAATHIQIGKGPLCLFPGPKYTSKNVSVKPQ